MKMSSGRKLPMLVVDEMIPVVGEKFVLVLQRKMSCCFLFAAKSKQFRLYSCVGNFSELPYFTIVSYILRIP